MIELKKYKHVIWDWNGTLFNDVELCSDIMNNLLRSRGLKIVTVEEYKSVFTFPVKKYYEILGHDVSDANWEIISHEFINEYETRKHESDLYPQAEQVIKFISEMRISQSVLSAYSQHTLEELIEHFNLTNYFMRLIGLDNIYAASKIENGIKWMTELGHNKGDVLLIGDTVHDFEVADEIGADSLLITEGHQAKKSLLECGVPVIDSLSELLSK
ncbi:MAG: HAD family hydrolase [Candidatus Pacebacteria bacterium]|nr:HAD family hydrolase [Candidatus Paceibacterota bacterium]